jgi:hypothetical protein
MELQKELRQRLGAADTDTDEMLVNKVGELKKKAETADAPGATVKAVCKALGDESLSETAMVAKIMALKESQGAVAKQTEELTALKQRFAQREAKELLETHGKTKLNPNAPALVAHFEKYAAEDPAGCIKALNEMPVICPEGRTAPPEGGAAGGVKSRETIIANAAKKFGEDASLAKLTTRIAYVSMKLEDAGQARLSDDEGKKVAA